MSIQKVFLLIFVSSDLSESVLFICCVVVSRIYFGGEGRSQVQLVVAIIYSYSLLIIYIPVHEFVINYYTTRKSYSVIIRVYNKYLIYVRRNTTTTTTTTTIHIRTYHIAIRLTTVHTTVFVNRYATS